MSNKTFWDSFVDKARHIWERVAGHRDHGPLAYPGPKRTTIPVPCNAIGLSLDQGLQRVFVSASRNNGDTLTAISTVTHSVVASAPIGGTFVAADPSTHRVYVSDYELDLSAAAVVGRVRVVDGNSLALLDTIPFGQHVWPWHLTVDHNRHRLYVLVERLGDPDTAYVAVFDTVTNALVAEIALPGHSTHDVAVNPLTNRIYVTAGSPGLIVIDGSTNAVVATLDLAQTNVTGVAVDVATALVYLGNWDEQVLVLSGTTHDVLHTVTVGTHPEGVAVDSARDRVVVTNRDGASISVIDTTTFTEADRIPVNPRPRGVVVDEVTGTAYVLSARSGPPWPSPFCFVTALELHVGDHRPVVDPDDLPDWYDDHPGSPVAT